MLLLSELTCADITLFSFLETKKGQESDEVMKLHREYEAPKLPGGEKMALILELSEQVAEQQDKISKLEHKLNEKEQVVTDLRTKLKNNAKYLSVLNKTNEGKGTEEPCPLEDGGSNKYLTPKTTNINKSTLTRNQMLKNDRVPFKNDHVAEGLFTVNEESSENEDDSLLKLSSYLSGVKADVKVRTSLDQSEEKKEGQIFESFEDLEANNGRDSGLGSAGKRDEKADKKVEFDRSGMDWKDVSCSLEAGSGLSDSDFEQYGPSQSKVSSAPPKLQNGGGVRHKKKSNSLRRHASSRKEDRPPRPGMAFVNSAGTLHKDDHIVNKLSPIISPVEVS